MEWIYFVPMCRWTRYILCRFLVLYLGFVGNSSTHSGLGIKVVVCETSPLFSCGSQVNETEIHVKKCSRNWTEESGIV